MELKKNNEYIKKIQSARIRECMKICNVTGRYIAEKLNYSPQHISYVINGKRNLSVELAISLAKLFSECMGAKTVNIPYKELSHDLKEEGSDEYINLNEDGINSFLYDFEFVDYKYLLGQTDYMSRMEQFDPPIEKTTNYLFKNGIQALLSHYGYKLELGEIFLDVTLFQNINPSSPLHSELQELFLNPKYKSEIINTSTNETLELLPADLYQLFQDFSKAIISIVERNFEKQKWLDAIHTAPVPYPKTEGPLWPCPDIDDDINNV